VLAAQAGDIDSFGKLCERYYSPLVAVAYAILGDHQLAEDAAQEAFARGLMGLPKLKDAGRFAPWLAQICRNVARDMAQSRRRSTGAPERSGTPDDHQANETAQIVRAAIDRLPASMREVVILRYYNSCSYEQITAVLGLSKTTINGRLTRAKRKIAECLRREAALEDML